MGITVIDDSDYVGWSASALRENEIYMVNVPSMVANVIAALRIYSRVCTPTVQYNKISRLNILDHGNEEGIELGQDWVTMRTLPRYEASLRQLRGRLEAGGFVHVQHCHAGKNRGLLVALARLWGAAVYAGTGYHNPIYRINYGEYVRAEPNGQVTSGVARP
ncbi:MAG TPA: DUF4347 domain-containing protein [Polyangiaceae bacterium]|nr:DUF4347 domain-containing protein [Polyangiaceae bacterium]